MTKEWKEKGKKWEEGKIMRYLLDIRIQGEKKVKNRKEKG